MKRLFLAGLLMLASLTAYAIDEKDKAFVNDAKRAVGLLYSQDVSGGMQMHCTATAFERVKDGYNFATAAHCVGSDEKEQSANPFKTSYFITFDETGAEKKFYPAKPVWVGYQSRGEDLAVFFVQTNATWHTVALGDEKKIVDGAQYWNVASPLGLGRQVFEGVVSNVYLDRPLIQGDINWKGTLVLQQAGVNGGSSGSALISKDQRAIIGFLVGSVGNSTIIAIPVSRFKAVAAAVAAGKYKYWKPQTGADGTPE
jgi:S1-C subfamily serine protease